MGALEPKTPGGSAAGRAGTPKGICHLHGAPILAVSTRQIVKEIVLKIQGSKVGFLVLMSHVHMSFSDIIDELRNRRCIFRVIQVLISTRQCLGGLDERGKT